MLDLFCGAGGAAVGYYRAGFDVWGVDIEPQPRYPFNFIQADALEVLDHGPALGRMPRLPIQFDVVHASPPCQAWSAMNRIMKREYPKLIEPVRERLTALGLPFVIENVEGAPLHDPVKVCGTMFGLRVRRHRLFEVHPTQTWLTPECACRGGVAEGRLLGTKLRRAWGSSDPKANKKKPPRATSRELRAAVGVDWMSVTESYQAIPPAYTEFIGRQLIRSIELAA